MITCASFSRREARAEGENGVVRSDANGDNIVFQRERERKREIEREKKRESRYSQKLRKRKRKKGISFFKKKVKSGWIFLKRR